MNEVSWTAVVLAAVAMVGTAINSITGYLTSRDKAKLDAKVQVLEVKLTNCEDNHAKAQSEIDALRDRIDVNHENASRDRSAVHHKLDDLDSRVAQTPISTPTRQ